MNRKLLILTLVIIGGIAGYFFLAPDRASDSSPGAPAPVTSVRLASSKNLWSALPILAQNKGYFKENGLNVEINYVQAAKFAMDALVGGSTEFASVVETNVSYLGFTGNKEVGVIATICQSTDSAIVARKSAGINQPSDLKGKKLGLLPGTTSQIYAERFLEKNGMTLADVQVVNLQAPAMQSSFLEKGVDAVSIWQPFVTNIAKAGGDDAVLFRDPQAYEALMNIATKRDFATAKKDIAKAFLKSLRSAAEFARTQPAEAQGILAKELNLDAGLVASVWDQYQWSVSLDTEKLTRAFISEGEWIKRTQKGFEDKAVPDYASAGYIIPGLFNELK